MSDDSIDLAAWASIIRLILCPTMLHTTQSDSEGDDVPKILNNEEDEDEDSEEDEDYVEGEGSEEDSNDVRVCVCRYMCAWVSMRGGCFPCRGAGSDGASLLVF